jgi:hypothetical protein
MVPYLGMLAFAALLANAQQLYMPSATVQRLPWPDGSKVLFGVPHQPGKNDGPQLWIEDTSTHRRTKLFAIGSTLSAGWSPDGSAFYVNDRLASDTERAYFYDAATLKRVDIAARILAEDPASRRFAGDHAYFEVTRWDRPQQAAVSFFGHTSGPVVCFQFRYRVKLTGVIQGGVDPSAVVERLSQRSIPAKTKPCSETP